MSRAAPPQWHLRRVDDAIAALSKAEKEAEGAVYRVTTQAIGPKAAQVAILTGTYRLEGENHGRSTFKKQESIPGHPDLNVFLYFWDTRDGLEFSGWWFGDSVGGSLVWARAPLLAQNVPPVGWKVPWDAPVPEPGVLCVQRAMPAEQGGVAVAMPAMVSPAAMAARAPAMVAPAALGPMLSPVAWASAAASPRGGGLGADPLAAPGATTMPKPAMSATAKATAPTAPTAAAPPNVVGNLLAAAISQAAAGKTPQLEGQKPGTVYLAGLPPDADEDELIAILSNVGAVETLKIYRNPCTMEPLGHGFCDFYEATHAVSAIQQLQGSEYRGKKLAIAQPGPQTVGMAFTPPPRAPVFQPPPLAGAGKPVQPLLGIALPSTAKVPQDFLDQLADQMKQTSGTSKNVCRYDRTCKSVNCTEKHANGREIEDDPMIIICRFQRSCKRPSCFYVHPNGREIDESRELGVCSRGQDCNVPECIFSHPRSRVPVMMKCSTCQQLGHTKINCPKTGGDLVCKSKVKVSGFPPEWSADGGEALVSRIFEELVPFGNLVAPPELSEDELSAVVEFDKPGAAWKAVHILTARQSPLTFEKIFEKKEDASKFGVFIASIDYTVSEEELKEHVGNVGVVKNLTLVMDKDTGKSKGYAFCHFHDSFTADAAIQVLNGMELRGRKISVTPIVENHKAESEDKKNATLFVGNIGKETDEHQLREALEQSAADLQNLETVRVARDKETQAVRGFGFLVFRDEASAMAAVELLQDIKVLGRKLKIRHAQQGAGDAERRGGDSLVWVTLFVDELSMPSRPELEPFHGDREVWADPLLDEGGSHAWLEEFGEVEDVFRIPDVDTGEESDRGYARFVSHDSASSCVLSGRATWSESERILSSHACCEGAKSKHKERHSAYPESIIAEIVGKTRREKINRVQKAIGAKHLNVRGDGLGKASDSQSQGRLHFACKGDTDCASKLQPALEKALMEIHQRVSERIRNGYYEREESSGKAETLKRRPETQPFSMFPGPGMAPPPGAWGPPHSGWGPPPPPDGPPPGWAPPDGWGAPTPPGIPYAKPMRDYAAEALAMLRHHGVLDRSFDEGMVADLLDEHFGWASLLDSVQVRPYMDRFLRASSELKVAICGGTAAPTRSASRPSPAPSNVHRPGPAPSSSRPSRAPRPGFRAEVSAEGLAVAAPVFSERRGTKRPASSWQPPLPTGAPGREVRARGRRDPRGEDEAEMEEEGRDAEEWQEAEEDDNVFVPSDLQEEDGFAQDGDGDFVPAYLREADTGFTAVEDDQL